MKIDRKIGFIGAGNMGEAMIGALIKANVFDSSSINISDANDIKLDEISSKYSVNTTKNNFRLFNKSDIVVLAIKPQIYEDVLTEIAMHKKYMLNSRKLVISIMAGISTRKIQKILYKPLDLETRGLLPIVRVMPNTSALVLSGMSGMCSNINVNFEDFLITKLILESMGSVIEFNEDQIDAVTALSGTGPAYVFYLVELMVEAGLKMGISVGDATELTIKTVKGAVKLLEEYKQSPENLRKKVTSPGGTTEAAFKKIEELMVKPKFIQGILAAEKRSIELGK